MTRPRVLTVISCGKSKSLDEGDDETVPARDLYSSGTHTCKERFAEHSAGYYIMSAMHGLLHPDEEIGYYNKELDEMTDAEKRQWARNVANDLLDVLEDGEYDGLVLLGRADYVAALERHFPELLAEIVTPFQTCDDVTGSGTAMRWCNDESNWPENVDTVEEIETVVSGWSE